MGLCGRCLSEFLGWRYSQSCWYFRPSFVNCCLSLLLSDSTRTNIQYVRGRGRYGVLSLRQINTCRIVPLQVNFFRWRHFCIAFMSLITVETVSHFTPQVFMLFLKHSVNESKSFICKHAAFETWSHFCRCTLDMLSYMQTVMQACIHAPGMQVWLHSCSQTCMEPCLHSARHEQPI
jgi:hypothetical protein